jgi:hypothetical protein
MYVYTYIHKYIHIYIYINTYRDIYIRRMLTLSLSLSLSLSLNLADVARCLTEEWDNISQERIRRSASCDKHTSSMQCSAAESGWAHTLMNFVVDLTARMSEASLNLDRV